MNNLYRDENIIDTLEKNYMPYAMSVIVSRAIPEIDGFKPSHRKLLFTMYKMGLLNHNLVKSANIVGQTMKVHPHGDGAIYETMVRLTRGNESLLLPLVESKGNFGKTYSRDMAYAASRYTEATLAKVAKELFLDLDKDTVDFVPNYDNTMTEPTLLPTTFPNILVNPNQGIAVGMASQICSFNLAEVCDTTIELIKNPDHIIESTLLAPDFSTGASLIYKAEDIENIYKTGRGSFKLRSVYSFDKKSKCIEITEIPYTTTIEAIKDKIVEFLKLGKFKEITDIRDESDRNGLKITIDLKKSSTKDDADKLMNMLYKSTPLEDSFTCNFNILISGTPRVLSVKSIIEEWTYFRRDCIKRRTYFELNRKKDKLHLLKGLEKILLDIDKAVKIVRETPKESEVITNLMIGFGISEIQAEYVAEIKLRQLNREYILNRTKEIENLISEIAELESILKDNKKIDKIIIADLKRVKEKYSAERKTKILYDVEEFVIDEDAEIPDYPCNLFFTKEGYFKKITPQSLRMSSNHKLKEGDFILNHTETTNKAELIFFSTGQNAYKSKAFDFDDMKASVMGEYIPSKLDFENEETAIAMVSTLDYSETLLFIYENGKGAKVPLKSYQTKTNRKKLLKAYSNKSPLVKVMKLTDDTDVVITSSNGKILVINTALIPIKQTKDTIGVNIMTQKGKNVVASVSVLGEEDFVDPNYYRTVNIPAVGKFLRKTENKTDQMTII